LSSRLRIGIIVAVLGLVLIVLGSVAVVRLYRSATEEPAEEVQEVDVATVNAVVASRDLLLGTLVTQDDVTVVEMPVEFTTRGSIELVEDAVNKILKVDLIQGEMVLDHNLAEPTSVTHDIAYVLSETHVLLAFPASDLMSQHSIIKRGDIVDVFVTRVSEIERINDQGETETTTELVTFDAMQRLNITAMVVDIVTEEGTTRAEGGEEEAAPRRSVNIRAYLLALEPQDALVMKYLKDAGTIFDFVLRAPTSTGQFNLTPVTTEYLTELYGLEILP
jgi:Flp pilus assembly protein CpaB